MCQAHVLLISEQNKKAKAFALLELTAWSKVRETKEYYVTAIEKQNILKGFRYSGGGYFNRKINGLIKVTLKQRLFLWVGL